MKVAINIFFYCFMILGFGQEIIEAQLLSSDPLEADHFIGKNAFGHIFYIQDDAIFKATENETFTYKNIALGTLSNVDILNPFEITLFYEDYNTVIQLDNQLNEINRVDFNFLNTIKTLRYAATANNKRLWIFDDNSLQLEVYNFETEQTEVATLPINHEVNQIKSNYNFCCINTNKGFLLYNIYGNLLYENKIENVEKFCWHHDFLVYIQNEKLYLQDINKDRPQEIELTPKLIIKDILLSGETLYIYNGDTVYTFALTLKKD